MASATEEDDEEDDFAYDVFAYDEWVEEEVSSCEDSDDACTPLATDPDFSSCGICWLDRDDSCRRSIQIELQRAKCRREEAYSKLLNTPSNARSKKTARKAYVATCHQEESMQLELNCYVENGVVMDLSHVKSRSEFVSMIEQLEVSVGWLDTDLKPDQKWEVPEDRLRALEMFQVDSRKLSNLKIALKKFDELNGDKANGCNSGMATKSEGPPSQIRATQEAVHSEAASEDKVDHLLKPLTLDEARPQALSKNRRRKLERKWV